MPVVWIPTGMQRLTDGQEQVRVIGATLRQVVNNLERQFPGVRDELCHGDAISPGLAVIVDGEAANLGMLEHVKEDSEIHFIPAIAGGAGL